jgi:release factor glutamine methyltransferase
MQQIDLYRELHTHLSNGIKPLRDKPEETIDSTLRALWMTASGQPMPPEATEGISLPVLSSDAITALKVFISKRLSGVPLAYITNRQRFCGLDFEVSPGAMIPRKETELLTRHALGLIDSILQSRKKAIVVDTCTGSGNVAISIAYYNKQAIVYAGDISEKAIEVCRKNAYRLGMIDHVTFSIGDLLAPYLNNPRVKGNVDIITCNPPYISTSKLSSLSPEIISHEPELAFNGGAFGINILNRILNDSASLLRKGGWLCIEVGEGQGPGILKKLHRDAQWGNAREVKDANGEIRVISLQR